MGELVVEGPLGDTFKLAELQNFRVTLEEFGEHFRNLGEILTKVWFFFKHVLAFKPILSLICLVLKVLVCNTGYKFWINIS